MAPSSDTHRSYISLPAVVTRQVEEEEEEEDKPRRQPRSNLRRAPSQANMHHTTVPQAILPSQLGSRNEMRSLSTLISSSFLQRNLNKISIISCFKLYTQIVSMIIN